MNIGYPLYPHQYQHTPSSSKVLALLLEQLLNLLWFICVTISDLRKATRRAGEGMSNGLSLVLVQMTTCGSEGIYVEGLRSTPQAAMRIF